MRGRVARLSLVIAVATAAIGPPIAAGARWDAGPSTPALAGPHAFASSAPSIRASAGPTDTGRVIVKLRKPPTAAARRSLRLDDSRPVTGPTLMTEAPPEGLSAQDYAAQLERSPLVEYAEPDYLLRPAASYVATPNDPSFIDPQDYQWTADKVTRVVGHARSWALRGEGSAHFDRVWPALARAKVGSAGVRVAVIDTGYDMNTRDNNGTIYSAKDECAKYNALTGALTTDEDVTPVPGSTVIGIMNAAHGTMTASEIGQWANNGYGSTGAAWDTQVAIYKVQGTVSVAGNGLHLGDVVIPSTALVNAIKDAVADAKRDHVPLVINISLELVSAPTSDVMSIQRAIDAAHAAGVVVVAASGNSDHSSVSYPAACSNVIAVGAYQLDVNDPSRADFSNYGSKLDIMAPGRLIWGPTKPNMVYDGDLDHPGYAWWNGTSMASPYVAAAAALLLRIEPTLTTAEVESLLESTAVDNGPVGRDDSYGWGLLDAYAAYRKLAAPRTTCDAKARYGGSATIHFSVQDRDSTATTTYHTMDGGILDVDGLSMTTDDIGHHVMKYWSVDSNGVAEDPHTVSFDVVPPDVTPPVTSSDAVDLYSGRALIRLSPTDTGGWGVQKTLYSIDGGATQTGALVTVGGLGDHIVQYWSTDQAGNTEVTKTVAFSVQRAQATVTIARNDGTISRGSKIKLSGQLTPGRVGDYVRIQYKSPGSTTWRYFTGTATYYKRKVTSATSSGRGTWSPLSYPLSKHGRYYFRVVFSGDEVYWSRTSATSASVSVSVR